MARTKVQKAVIEEPPPTLLDRKASFDLGNAYSNLKADGPVIDDFRSVIGSIGAANQLKGIPFGSCLKIDGIWYVVGDDAYTVAAATIEDFPTKDRYTSAWYRRLFAFALFKAYGSWYSEGILYPRIVSSVPASEFKIKERVEQIKANLTGRYELEMVSGACLHIVIKPENLTVIPEGAGTYYGQLSVNPKFGVGTWGILDLGYLTGDIVIFRDGNYIATRAVSDSTIGVCQIAEHISAHIYAAGGPELPAHEIDKELNCNAIIANGVHYNIAEAREGIIHTVAERINRFLVKATSQLNMTGVIVAGGGVDAYYDYIDAINKQKPANPYRSNVDGAFSMLED